MKCALLWVVLAAPVPVQDKISPPKGLPPSWATAVLKDGKLTLQQSVLVPETRAETRQTTELIPRLARGDESRGQEPHEQAESTPRPANPPEGSNK